MKRTSERGSKGSNTDLGSLIGKFDCEFSTVWNFSQFPGATLILQNIDFGWFQRVKNCHFTILEALNFDFFWKSLAWKCQKIPTIQNSELIKWLKWYFLGHQNHQTWFHVLSDRKILWFPQCNLLTTHDFLQQKIRENNFFMKQHLKLDLTFGLWWRPEEKNRQMWKNITKRIYIHQQNCNFVKIKIYGLHFWPL